MRKNSRRNAASYLCGKVESARGRERKEEKTSSRLLDTFDDKLLKRMRARRPAAKKGLLEVDTAEAWVSREEVGRKGDLVTWVLGTALGSVGVVENAHRTRPT